LYLFHPTGSSPIQKYKKKEKERNDIIWLYRKKEQEFEE